MTPKPSSGLRFDVAVLSVIPPEFKALQKALNIDLRKRIRIDGAIYFEGNVYSQLLQQNIRIILGCADDASQANASAMATRMIAEFDPALIVLIGIAAGMRHKVRIGDVVVPREVVDLTAGVLKDDGRHPRPQSKPWPFAVKQMMHGFDIQEALFHERCREIFGPPIIPPPDKEAEYATHVTFTPRVADSPIGSSDNLLKSVGAFAEMLKTHEGIRAAEMEAGGFIKACESHRNPRHWLVVRGISDFGDELKDDQFHRLAAAAAAAWLLRFLEDGFDLFNLVEEESLRENVGQNRNLAPTTDQVPSAPQGLLTTRAADFINSQIENLARSATADRLRDFEDMREAWRIGREQRVLDHVREMKGRHEWPLVDAQVRAKFLRFEASLLLAIEKNVALAKELAAEAAALDTDTNPEALHMLIAYHEDGIADALLVAASPATLDGWNVRLSLLVEGGNWQTVLGEFTKPPTSYQPDAESRRLHALALLFCNKVAEARVEIVKALAEHPQWFNLRFAAAVIDYFESLSPALLARTSKIWPAPTDPSLVRRDPAAVSALRRAVETFTKLLEGEGLNIEMRVELEGWRLACLANDTERRNEAQAYCASLLEREPKHRVALPWATARGYVSDLHASVDALFAELLPAS